MSCTLVAAYPRSMKSRASARPRSRCVSSSTSPVSSPSPSVCWPSSTASSRLRAGAGGVVARWVSSRAASPYSGVRVDRACGQEPDRPSADLPQPGRVDQHGHRAVLCVAVPPERPRLQPGPGGDATPSAHRHLCLRRAARGATGQSVRCLGADHRGPSRLVGGAVLPRRPAGRLVVSAPLARLHPARARDRPGRHLAHRRDRGQHACR
jgi:hypothetical protein